MPGLLELELVPGLSLVQELQVLVAGDIQAAVSCVKGGERAASVWARAG